MAQGNPIVPFQKGLQTQQTSSLLKTFIGKFLSDELFIDMINMSLYPATFSAVTIGGNNSTVEYIKEFLFDLSKVAKALKLGNVNVIYNNISLVNTLFTIRETGSSILNYQNVFQHVPSQDINSQGLIKKAIDGQLKSVDDFRKVTDNTLRVIGMYYEVTSIRSTLVQLGNFSEYSSNTDITPYEVVKHYKDLIINAYNDLSGLQSVNKAEAISDYFVLCDKQSSEVLAETLFRYVSQEYSFFKTGFDLFDKYIEGFESSSVHLISAPSNHGKSIFMVNLAHMMCRVNYNDFMPGDAVVFVTLEDDIYKLSRRFMSVFGNYRYGPLKRAFKQSYEISKANELTDSKSNMGIKVKSMFKNLIDSSVTAVTNGKFAVIVKHENENVFSPGDLGRFLDRLKVEGWNAKMVFMDYVDCATPTIQRYSSVKDYDLQGQIVQELRNLSRAHKLPVITATQNSKISENMNTAMDNTQIGDSYKKVRYADFLYMCRMRRDLNPLADPVLSHVTDKHLHYDANSDQLKPEILKLKSIITDVLIPFEVKITKSKESGKDFTKFSLFCTENLRIYNNIQEYLDDARTLYPSSKRLENDIQSLTDLAITSVTEEFDQTPENFQDAEQITANLMDKPDFLA